MNILTLLRSKKEPLSPQKFSGEGTVLISFIRKLDQVATLYSPERLIKLLKKHLATQSKIIENHSGLVLSYEGDAIIAFWPKIEPEQNCALQAFEAAQEMLSTAYNVLDYQIVLGTGLVAGDFFGPTKQYQVVGEGMDLADQLSRFCFPVHRAILLTDSTKAHLVNLSASFQSIGQLRDGSDISAFMN